MYEWMFDRTGAPRLLHIEVGILDRKGLLIAWVFEEHVFDLKGKHVGWLDGGVLYDIGNNCVAFEIDATSPLPSIPPLKNIPNLPTIKLLPTMPLLSRVKARPAYGDWSKVSIEDYFSK